MEKDHQFFFPHDAPTVNTRDIIKGTDLVIAEVSYPATGQGIELGWANAFNIPIVCFYKKDSKISNSLKFIADNFIEYLDAKDLITKLEFAIKSYG
ncbi:TPA: hypothetical protein DDW69_01055 [candidate division CPR2 bacterium]|uniref:N-(Deoxy)ribosyltransferase-like protein n=1 Tax=candidate division CPR2 bacterium GW2011_GWC1_41_48 TaxID=1618344 RepID=A0A0G0WC44_UNCC2|nr:MAG: hypothetical protein UT47_C0001G0017 [candidate division CPR2 bacterium GW2011_GWC2_39_35]KKR28207.1 MAG: hypothetical protein UT60_C0025G0005 [candidate division CPR2 bacterium GW2011_GWD2_39_7]KKR28638.1 MAG: hypothetical protein UT59_C0022G0006 [candidate division CPR2 bacterium GW2011_GWD1_39_7]KKS09612.1 MAG: N-(deoxy)ribosyltransferase-like protein [candidate division CPR2 bacterium GW2011_GWC1_41_48]OGB61321.1 MAG: hypothetical protein A2Y27_02685 [candidate division CPR2 bacteri